MILYCSVNQLNLKERDEHGNLLPEIGGYGESKVMNAMNVSELARQLKGKLLR